MAGRTRHKEMHDTLGFRGPCFCWMLGFSLRQGVIAAKHRSQRKRAQAAAGLPQEFAARRQAVQFALMERRIVMHMLERFSVVRCRATAARRITGCIPG